MRRAIDLLRRLCADRVGSTAVTFAIALPVLALAVGGGIDAANAVAYRQDVASVVELTCNQAALEIRYLEAQQTSEADDQKGKKPSKGKGKGRNDKEEDDDDDEESSPSRDVDAAVAVANDVGSKRLSGADVPDGIVLINTIQGDILTTRGTADSETYFAGLLGFTEIPVGATRKCSIERTGGGTSNGSVLFLESFESAHNVAPNSWTVLKNWNGWQTRDAGVEINGIPELSAGTIRFGNFFAELDSHCYVSNCNSNSTMSRIMSLAPGEYEVRYWYISRIRNTDPKFKGVAACGTEADVAPYASWQQSTNRIEVFIERQGDYTFNTRNMVDRCVYSDHWTERKINFRVGTQADYRISWRAAGKQDTVGGLIDYIRICSGTCP